MCEKCVKLEAIGLAANMFVMIAAAETLKTLGNFEGESENKILSKCKWAIKMFLDGNIGGFLAEEQRIMSSNPTIH